MSLPPRTQRLKSITAWLCSSLFSLCFNSAAVAVTLKVELQGSEPLYQTTLTKEVYQHSRTEGLADVTIHNNSGEQVPYARVDYATLHPYQAQTSLSTLKLFPIQEQTLTNTSALKLQLSQTGDSTHISVDQENTGTHSKTIYLVDAGENHKPLQNFVLTWQGQEGILINVEVLSSDNLKDWHNVGQGVLLKTKAQGNSIEQNSLHLDTPNQSRYFQLRAINSMAGFNITQVQAQFALEPEQVQATLWEDIPFMQRLQAKGEINIDFEALGHYPASAIRIHLPQENTITHVQIFVRNNINDPWQIIGAESLYRMVKEGKAIHNPDITIQPQTARYWRLRFNENSGGLGQQNPILSLGWLPDTLVWNARGGAPFSLRVGEAPASVNLLGLESLIPHHDMTKLKSLPVARLSPGNAELAQASSWATAPDYRRWLLWGGLILGVVLLGGMVVSLLKNNQDRH